MHSMRFIESMKRRIVSPWGFAGLLIVASFTFWFVQAHAAVSRDQPYKYELIEECPGIKIVVGITDPTIDARDIFIETDGKREPITPVSLMRYVDKKYAAEGVDVKIEHFVRLFNPYPARIIESVNDIPEYAPDQFDPDIDPKAIKTYAWSKEAKHNHNYRHQFVVKYAWEWMGNLQRFRFEIRKETGAIIDADVSVIQARVGEVNGLD